MPSDEPKKLVVANVAAFDPEGKLLVCRDAQTGKWCLPGGKAEEGEQPHEAAVREFFEEVGQVPADLEFLGEHELAVKPVHLHSYKAKLPSHLVLPQPTEVSECRLVEPSEVRDLPGGWRYDFDLAMELLCIPIAWAGTNKLLASEDPVQRAMALKMSGLTDAEVFKGLADPDPAVLAAALDAASLMGDSFVKALFGAYDPAMPLDAYVVALVHNRITDEVARLLVESLGQEDPLKLAALFATAVENQPDVSLDTFRAWVAAAKVEDGVR